MDKRKLSLKKSVNKDSSMTDDNTESDVDLANEHMEMSQKLKTDHTHRIIPISFNIEGLDGELNDNNGLINECSGKIEKLLEKRLYVANLLRDLRKYEDDNLPIYARISPATFAPKFGSDEAANFFKEKMNNFTRDMRVKLRITATEATRELFNNFTEEMEKVWKEATGKIDLTKEGGHTTLRKLNEKVQNLKEKWANKYRNGGLENTEHSEISKLRRELKEIKETSVGRRGDKETNTIGDIKRELEELKGLISDKGPRYDRRDYRGGRGGRRGRRYDY